MTTRRALAGTLLASSVLLTTAARSQEASLISLEGKKVRLLAPAILSGQIEGVVVDTDQQSLLISQATGTRLKVPRQTVTQLEMSTGRHRHTLKGMWIGAGLLLLLATPTVVRGHAPASDAALAALAGGMWGAGIGTLMSGERWQRIPRDQVTPRPSDATASLRVVFKLRL
jgi:RNase P/RNase MRP subunit p29